MSDTRNASRKGRKPNGEKAMTPVERKRQQRQRQREAKSELPSWLRLRRDLWKVIQDHFLLADVDELADALNALNAAISIANCYRSDNDPLEKWITGLTAYCNPPERVEGVLQFFPELKAYRFNETGFPNRKGTKLVDILRDIVEGHEKDSEP